MAKFFLLLGKNDGNKRRYFSSFPFLNLETREYPSVFSDFFLLISGLSQILSDLFHILSDVFKIAWEEIRKKSLKIAQTSGRFIKTDGLFR